MLLVKFFVENGFFTHMIFDLISVDINIIDSNQIAQKFAHIDPGGYTIGGFGDALSFTDTLKNKNTKYYNITQPSLQKHPISKSVFSLFVIFFVNKDFVTVKFGEINFIVLAINFY